jgi:apolipoprotein N-acyltransferase
VPASTWLRPLYERIATVPLLDTVQGPHDQGGIILGGVRVALKLCFEDLFPDLFRDEVAAGRFIVVLANDSWDGSDAPMHQHLQISQTRAAEAAKPLVRVANTGWSALIGPDGRRVAVAPPDQPAMLEVFVQPREGITPYTRHGDAIPVGLAALAVVIALASAGQARPGEFAHSEIAA